MFKIQVFFKSNIKGVYVKEEETATDKIQLDYKTQRLINRWFDILCPHIDFSIYHSSVLRASRLYEKNADFCDELIKLRIGLIKQTLDEMDEFDELITGEDTTEETMRKFEFTVEEI